MYHGIDYVTCRLMVYGFMRLATLQFETKLQKCIKMGIAIYSKFSFGEVHVYRRIYGRKSRFWLRSRIAAKLNFRLYIRRYTSQNENVEYRFPLIFKQPTIHASESAYICCQSCTNVIFQELYNANMMKLLRSLLQKVCHTTVSFTISG